jgi:hypothetical protein
MSSRETAKHKVAVLIEKHIITTKIGYLLRAFDNCSKTTNVQETSKKNIYITRIGNDKIKKEKFIDRSKINVEKGRVVVVDE